MRFVYTSSGQSISPAPAGARGQPRPDRRRAQVGHRSQGREAVATRLRESLETVPGLTYEFERPALLTFRVRSRSRSPTTSTRRAAAAAVAAKAADVRGIADVESSIRYGSQVQVAFNRDRLAALRLDPASASLSVRNAVQGEAATQFTELDRKLDVRVRASEDQRSLVSELANLEVGRNDGRSVPLAAVADIKVARGPGEIRRIAQQRAAVVSANLVDRDLAATSKDIMAELDGLKLPPDVRVVLAGQNRELAESFGSLRFAIILAIFLVYLVMASQFESLLHPFVIMFTLPMAVVGVVLTLVLTGTSINVMVLIGLVVLAGIVVNNGIVLIDCANQLRAAGRRKLDALVEAGSMRLRPILMTALTTILGLVPMALGFGEGAEVRAPLALTLIGGLASGTVLTLIVLPVVYAALDRRD